MGERGDSETSAASRSFGLTTTAEAPTQPRIELPRQIGRFRILSLVGGGAMGVVYLAFDPELDRNVALKLVGDSVGQAREFEERLRREAKSLAKLSHPNVVQVFEAGAVDDRLYVAMEFLEGTTLKAWCAARPRSVAEIVGVCYAAGRGLQEAHSAHVVHRDFKPSNVLVTPAGRVVVIDFGLARPDLEVPPEVVHASGPTALKVVLPGSTELRAASMTRTGAMLGTPAYMAPEQFFGTADARSDQFAFCVTLYEAVYGERPFAGDSVMQLYLNISRGRVAAPSGRKVPSHVRRALRRGLSVHPSDRYPSMAELLAELANERGQRRGRVLLAAGLGAAVVGGAVFGWTRIEPDVCANETQIVRDNVYGAEVQQRLRVALVTAPEGGEAVAQVIDTSVRRYVDELTQVVADTCAGSRSDLLFGLRIQCVERRRAELSALLVALIGGDSLAAQRAVEAVDDLDPATTCADDQALEIESRRVSSPSDPALRIEVHRLRIELAGAQSRVRAGQYMEAKTQLAALAGRADETGYLPVRAEVLALSSQLARERGDFVGALAEQWRALVFAEEAGHSVLFAQVAAERASLLGADLARAHEAETWAELASAHARRAGSDDLSAEVAMHRGRVAKEQAEFAAAQEHFEQALQLRSASRGAVHTSVAEALIALGEVLEEREQFDDAIRRLRQAIEIYEQRLGASHFELARPLTALGRVLTLRGKYEEAAAHFDRAVELAAHGLGAEHPDLARALTERGFMRSLLRQSEAALADLERALAIQQRSKGPTHPDVARVLQRIGYAEEVGGRVEKAYYSKRRALSILEATFPPSHPAVLRAQSNLGNTQVARWHFAEADAIYRRVLDVAAGDRRHDRLVALTQAFRARALVELGRYDEAEASARASIASYEQEFGAAHFRLFEGLVPLGRAALKQGRTIEAVQHLRRALELWRANVKDLEPVADVQFFLAQALWRAGELDEALRTARSAAQTIRASKHESLRRRLDEIEGWLADESKR